jgi:hypothetical protein
MLQKIGPIIALLGVSLPTFGAWANADGEARIRPTALMELAFDQNGEFQASSTQTCKVTFKATPASNTSRWAKWSPVDGLLLSSRTRPEIVEGKTHFGYKFKTCTSIYPNGKAAERVNTCLEMKVDCRLPGSSPVPADQCVIAQNFSRQYILSRQDVSDQTAMDECKKAMTDAAAKAPTSLTNPAAVINAKLTAPSMTNLPTGKTPIADDESLFAPSENSK